MTKTSFDGNLLRLNILVSLLTSFATVGVWLLFLVYYSQYNELPIWVSPFQKSEFISVHLASAGWQLVLKCTFGCQAEIFLQIRVQPIGNLDS